MTETNVPDTTFKSVHRLRVKLLINDKVKHLTVVKNRSKALGYGVNMFLQNFQLGKTSSIHSTRVTIIQQRLSGQNMEPTGFVLEQQQQPL